MGKVAISSATLAAVAGSLPKLRRWTIVGAQLGNPDLVLNFFYSLPDMVACYLAYKFWKYKPALVHDNVDRNIK